MRKYFLILFSSLLVLAGCANTDSSSGGCTTDGALQVLSPVHVKNTNEVDAWNKQVSDALGFDVELTYVADDYDTYLDSSLNSDLCYDVIYTTDSTKINADYALNLDEYIKNSDTLSNPDVIPTDAYDDVKEFSGQDSVYGIPNKNEGNLVLIYRKDWLDEFGMDEPTTLKEWQAYMQEAHDKYGAYGFASSLLYDIQPFMSAKGLKYGLDYDQDGNLYVPYASDEAAEIYDWLGNLYDAGLYEPNLLTNDTATIRNEMLSGDVAVIGYWDTWVGLMNDQMQGQDFEVAGASPVLDENKNGLTRKGDPGVFMVNKNSQKVDEAIKFLEYMHSDEGELLNSAGISGVDYNVQDGQIEFTEQGKQDGGDHGVPRSLNQVWEKPYSDFPLEGTEEACDKVKDYGFIANTRDADFASIEDIINKYAIDSIIDPSLSGEDAVKSMQKEIEPILNEQQ